MRRRIAAALAAGLLSATAATATVTTATPDDDTQTVQARDTGWDIRHARR